MTLPVIIGLVIGIVLPGITTLVTRETASPRLKAFVAAAMSALAAAATTALTTPPHDVTGWEELIVVTLVSWVTAGGAYFLGWKPTGATKALARATAGFGITDRSGSDEEP